jgi:rare lipoprotein A
MKNLTILVFTVIIAFLSSCSTAPNSPEKAVKALEKRYKKAKVLDTQHGIASWYSVRTNRGTRTASGRKLEDNAYTTAHRTYPFGSKVRVTNLSNGRSEILTVTNRGPFKRGRVVDVTIGSSKRLGFYSRGLTKVKVELLERGDWKYKRTY